MTEPELVKFKLQTADLAVRLKGDQDNPALLLLHGFPNSSRSFRKVIGTLARDCFVIAPDLPGFGSSEPIERASFSRFSDTIQELLTRLAVKSFHLYLHDFGAAVGLYLATRAPHAIRSLLVQNANAHTSGLGSQWAATKRYWAEPTAQHEAQAIAHLTFEGTRDQYVAGVPQDIAKHVDPTLWEEDFRIMSLPGRLETQRALVLDYRSHVARFGDIADYLAQYQPSALMLWGRHDAFFELDETVAWMKALPRMEAHVLDGSHFLLETHASECAALIGSFLGRVETAPQPSNASNNSVP